VESDGLWATFSCARPYRYRTVQPAGYTMNFEGAQLTVQRSGVLNGALNGVKAVLPEQGVRDKDGNRVTVSFVSLAITTSSTCAAARLSRRTAACTGAICCRRSLCWLLVSKRQAPA
jgi:hypothetical protein